MTTYFKILFFSFLLFVISFSVEMSAKQTSNILFIHSYTENDTWSYELNKGLRKGFKENGISVDITTEYLNSRYLALEEEELYMSQICQRARERGTDLIVTSNDEALYTLLTCGDTLPSVVPVVFSGVQFPNYKILKKYPNATGLIVPLAYDKLLKTIKEVFPKRKNVIVLSEETTLARWGTQAFKEDWEEFIAENKEYTIKEFNVTFDPLTDIVRETQLSLGVSNSVVVTPYWGLFMSSIAKVSKAPTFSTNASALMHGGFCVVAPYAYEEALEAAKIATRILKGENAASIEIQKSKNQFTYDYKQLDFFKIGKDDIPKSSVIINQPYTGRYSFLFILLYALVLGALVSVVVKLVAVNRREARRRIQAQTKLLIQSRLVAQRNEFDNVFHSIRDAVVTYDMDCRIHFVNRAVLRVLGVEPPTDNKFRPYEGQLSSSLCEFINNGENILLKLLHTVQKEGTSIIIPEHTFVKVISNGRIFPISGEVVPLRADGQQKGIVLSFRNISAETLQKYYYNLAVAESSIYPCQYDKEDNMFIFSDECLIKMGFEANGRIHKDELEKRIHFEDLEETRKKMLSVVNGELRDVRLTFRLCNEVGKYEWWEFRILGAKGLFEDIPYSVIGVCQSIQQYKTTEEELIAARDRALQADKLKTAFLANMSHEIRTPLNAIVGFSDLLRDIHMFSEEDVHQFVATINKNCELLLALISDILDISRVEAGTMDFQYSPYYLPIIMQEVYDSQRLNMPSGVELIKQIPVDSERTIITDSVRLKQILNNLINNAAKFTTSGSITFGYTENEIGYTTFFVEDTGIGLSEEEQKRIFERFYKADSFTQGAGLGLSITQTIIGRLQGTIAVESELGKGTRFTVRIPDKEEYE